MNLDIIQGLSLVQSPTSSTDLTASPAMGLPSSLLDNALAAASISSLPSIGISHALINTIFAATDIKTPGFPASGLIIPLPGTVVSEIVISVPLIPGFGSGLSLPGYLVICDKRLGIIIWREQPERFGFAECPERFAFAEQPERFTFKECSERFLWKGDGALYQFKLGEEKVVGGQIFVSGGAPSVDEFSLAASYEYRTSAGVLLDSGTALVDEHNVFILLAPTVMDWLNERIITLST
jgi:hypothetical protein